MPDPARVVVTSINLLAMVQWRLGQGGMTALTQWLAQRARLGYARVDPLKLDMAAITEVVAYAYAARCGILPIKSTPTGVVLAVKDPFDVHWMRDLELSLTATWSSSMRLPARSGSPARIAPDLRRPSCAISSSSRSSAGPAN